MADSWTGLILGVTALCPQTPSSCLIIDSFVKSCTQHKFFNNKRPFLDLLPSFNCTYHPSCILYDACVVCSLYVTATLPIHHAINVPTVLACLEMTPVSDCQHKLTLWLWADNPSTTVDRSTTKSISRRRICSPTSCGCNLCGSV